jgi:hypothetical protein
MRPAGADPTMPLHFWEAALKRPPSLYTAIAALLLVSGPASAAVVYGSSKVETGSFADVGIVTQPIQSGSDDSPTTPTHPLQSATSQTATNQAGTVTATNSETTTATFASASSVTISFLGSSSASLATFGDAEARGGNYYSGSNFLYSFSITGTETYSLDYNLGAMSTGASVALPYPHFVGLSGGTSGTLTGTIGPGSYQIFIADDNLDGTTFQDLVEAFEPGSYSIGHSDSFDLSFTAAVPEAATWAMLLIGFAGIGFAGYRKSVSRRSRESQLLAE